MSSSRSKLIAATVATAALLALVPAAQAKGPAGPYDRAFLVEMVGHHSMAVDMAEMAKEKSTHAELRQTADDIVRTQSAEIASMQRWLKRWYGKRAHPKQDMEEMDQMKELDSSSGAAFEIRFMALMTVHHTLAIERATVAVKRARHAKVRKLARSIIKAQKGEIAQFREWLVAWYAS